MALPCPFEPFIPALEIRRKQFTQRRYIAFLDILGFSSAVCKSETSDSELDRVTRVLSYLKKIEDHLQALNEQYGSPSFTIISDSIVISFPVSDVNIVKLFTEVGSLARDVVACFGFLIRGGITEGPLDHARDRLCGPGYLKAYNMEQSLAVWPRIMVDKIIAEKIMAEDSVFTPLIKCDQDGAYKLDYLRKGFPCGAFPEAPYVQVLQNTYRATFIEDDASCNAGFKSETILKKLIWYRNYVKECAEEVCVSLHDVARV